MTTWKTAEIIHRYVWNGLDLPVYSATPDGAARGLAVVLHGRNGAPDQPHMVAVAEAYLRRGWRVLAPQLPYSLADPGSGPANRATMGIHRRASADVAGWAKQAWPAEPFAVAGHSLGAYAAPHIEPDNLQHLLAVSPALSGRALLSAREEMGGDAVAVLANEAPDMYAEMAGDDAEPALARLAAPAAVVTGAEDGLTPLKYAKRYVQAAPNARFFMALPGQHHCPSGPDCDQALDAALTALEA